MHLLRTAIWAALFSVALLPLGGNPAEALSIFPNPVDIPDYFPEEGIVARVTSLGSVTGTPAGGIVLSGSVALTDTTLLFTLEYVGESIDALGILAIQCTGCAWSAVGWIPGADEDWTSSTRYGTTASAASWPLDTGLISDVLFVSIPSIAVGTVLNLSFNGYHGVPFGSTTATVVPEAATLTLLSAGLIALATRRRR